MRVLIRAIALIAAPVLIFGLSLGFAPNSLASGAESIVTTLYAYPTLPSWQQVESAAPTVSASIVDICAPDGSGSGCNGQPADAENTVWPPTIQALQQAGITPLYYIWTDYGATPLATVESELQNAITWYGVSSPMFDGTSTSASEASYYQTLYNFAIANGAKIVMFNPGTVAPQSYMFGPDEILQQFEGTEAQFDAATFPSWMSSYPASEFSATISAGTSAGVGTDVSDAAQDGIGNIYVDDEAEPPNYSTLPAFWSAEVQDVAGTTAPAAQTITFPSPGPGVVGPVGHADGYRRRVGQPGGVLGRCQQRCGRVLGVGHQRVDGQLPDRGHLRDRRQPGGRQRLRGRTTGAADDHGQRVGHPDDYVPQSWSRRCRAVGHADGYRGSIR